MLLSHRRRPFGVLAVVLIVGALATPIALPTAGLANEYAPQLERFLNERVRPFLSDPLVISSIHEQNAAHETMTQAEIDALDQQWIAESRAGGGRFIEESMARAISQFLIALQAESGGMIAEIFIMDNKGLNVGQSAPTSDYWQGDEAKWQKTFLIGPEAIFVDDIDFDDSAGVFLSQVSAAIADPDSGEVIGAVTLGVNIEHLD